PVPVPVHAVRGPLGWRGRYATAPFEARNRTGHGHGHGTGTGADANPTASPPPPRLWLSPSRDPLGATHLPAGPLARADGWGVARACPRALRLGSLVAIGPGGWRDAEVPCVGGRGHEVD